MITQAELKKNLIYCCDTGTFTRLVSNNLRVNVGDVAGTKRRDGYVEIGLNKKDYLAHRLAWLYAHGEFPIEFIDHINGVRDDNRLVNLREATRVQNQHNHRKANANNASGLLGVYWHKVQGKYVAQITQNGKHIHIAYFTCKYEAHQAYLAKKREIHPFSTI